MICCRCFRNGCPVRGERGQLRVRRLDRVDEESSQDEQRQEADIAQHLDDVPLDIRQVTMPLVTCSCGVTV